MSNKVEKLVAQANALSPEDRTYLADLLLAAIPDGETAEIDASSDKEFQRRVAAVCAGTAKTVSARDVHQQARRLYQP